MSTDHAILGFGFAVLLISAIWTMLQFRKGKPSIISPGTNTPGSRLRQAFDDLEDRFKDVAMQQIEEAIGQKYAEEHKNRILGSFAASSPKEAPSSSPPSSG